MDVHVEIRQGRSWARDLAAALAQALEAAMGERAAHYTLFAAAGGATPAPVLTALAPLVDWSRIRIVPSDERLTTDPAFRNQTMIARAIGGLEILALEALPDLAVPDVALIGFGGDRHIASIFPAGEGMDAARTLDANAPTILRTIPDPLPAEAPFARITFTLAALVRTPRLFIAARGPAKRAVFNAAAAEEPAHSPLALLISARSAAGIATQVWLDDDQAGGDRSA